MKSYKSWTRDPIPSHRSQTRSLAFFFSYKSCIPNQPLIRKINLLKGSVTPRGIFCGRSGRWKKKRGERRNGILSDYGISSAFFPAHLYRQVQQGLHKVSTVRLHGVCVQERLCFPDTWTLEGSTWREGPASRRSTGREVEPVVCSRTYCASNDPVYGVISEKQSRLSASRFKIEIVKSVVHPRQCSIFLWYLGRKSMQPFVKIEKRSRETLISM